MEFRKSRPISLKAHPVYREKWLQERLAEDPSLLGLGDLVMKDAERRQPRAGRLDLLLSDPETSEFRIPRSEEIAALLDDSGIETLEYDKRYNRYRIRLTAPEVTKHRELLIDLIRRASGTPEPSPE
jgi:hypothetical protein